MNIDQWHILIVGLGWLGGLVTVAWSLFTDRVLPYRTPLYWLAMPVAAMMALIYGHTFLAQVWDARFMSNTTIGYILRVAVFLLALEFYLVPWVDRLEKRTKEKVDKVIHPEGNDHGVQ